jgi:transposase-like protein
MKWKDMTAQERYRVLEMARRGDLPITKVCRTFAVSRQALNRAMEKASEAAMQSLEPKKPGRKGKSAEEQEITELTKKTTGLEKTVKHWKTRYEVAHAFIDLMRETNHYAAPGSQKKKRLKVTRLPAKKVSESGAETGLAGHDDGRDTGDNVQESQTLDEEA